MRVVINWIKIFAKSIFAKPEIKLTLSCFFITRTLLTLIGVTSRIILESHRGRGRSDVLKNVWLDIWGVWDTGWYLNIAQNWYTTDINSHGGANYGFFPLYPFLMRIVGWFVQNNYIGGIIVSNAALLVSCIFLYKLVEREASSKIALNSIKFLFLFPTAFIFSAVFSESLFVACMLVSFYFARGNRWFWAGFFGGLTALTRSIGVFVCLPLFYEYIHSKDFKVANVRVDVLCLSLVPIGLSLFAFLNYRLTGDFLAFSHIQQTGWKHEWTNPFSVLLGSLVDGDPLHFLNGIFSITAVVVLSAGIRTIGFSFWLMGMILLFFPPLAGKVCMNSMLRYGLVVFPFYLMFAKISENPIWYWMLVITLTILQGVLMVYWTNGYHLII